MFPSDFTQSSKMSSSSTLQYDGITSSYHSYLSSFSKDINRSLDANRVQRFIDTQSFIQSHNNRHHHHDISSHSFNRPDDESLVDLNDFRNKVGTNAKEQDAKQSASTITTPTFFLRENQFSDLTHQEMSKMFIQDPLSFDSTLSPISTSITAQRINSSIGSDSSSNNRRSVDNDYKPKLDITHNEKIHNDEKDMSVPVSSNVYLDFNLRRQRDSNIIEPYNNAKFYDTIVTTSSSSSSSVRSSNFARQVTTATLTNSTNNNDSNSDNNNSSNGSNSDNAINSFFKPTYATSFNWATNNNPKQRSILPSGVRNQGMCGACWAFVASSSVEASISKNVDYFVTKDISSPSSSSSSLHTHTHNHSQHTQDITQHSDSVMASITSDITTAATTTNQSYIDNNNSSDVSNGRHDKHDENNDTKITHTSHGLSDNGAIALSVQELIDCDTEYDRGCAGGNPVNAFRYIMAHGLTTADSYPLSTQQKTGGSSSGGSSGSGRNTAAASSNTCRSTETDPVRGSIKGFISITPFRQDLMLQSLVTQGPLSVGICGTDMTFLYYGGGIYNPETCCSTLNHALLIIGYGTDSTSGLDYWLVQNSWGSLWGEGGYMRILRSSSSDIAHPGVCGLALTPSVALGGYFMKGGNFSKGNNNGGGGSGSNTDDDKNHNGSSSYYGKIKDMINNIHTWMTSNWKMALFAAISACFLLSSTAFLYLCILDFASHHFHRRRGRSGSTAAANSTRNRSQRVPNNSNKASIMAVGTGVAVLVNDSRNTATTISNNNNKTTTTLPALISSSTGLINNTNTSTNNNYNYSNSTTNAIIPKPSPQTTYPLSIMKGSNNNNSATAAAATNNNNKMGNMPTAATIAAFNKPSYTNKTFYSNNNTSNNNNSKNSNNNNTTTKSMPMNINRKPSFTTADAASGSESETVALISISGKHKRDKTYTSTTGYQQQA